MKRASDAWGEAQNACEHLDRKSIVFAANTAGVREETALTLETAIEILRSPNPVTFVVGGTG